MSVTSTSIKSMATLVVLCATDALPATLVGPSGPVEVPPLLTVPLPGGIHSCDTLFALRVAEAERLGNCDTQIVPAGICTGLTANACQASLHADADTMAPPAPTAGDLLYSYLPQCVDGSGTCTEIDRVHCIDGTRPMLHADKARHTDGTFIESNRWIIYVSGGGSCEGPRCWNQYVSPGSRLEMSTCHPDAFNCRNNGQSHAGTRRIGAGLLSPQPDNPFAEYNRVRLNKCTYDGFQGDEFESHLPVDRNGDGIFEQRVRRVYHQGHLVYKTALNYLAGGVTLGDGTGPALPPLANAELVILAGNSGGGKAMIMTGDLLRDHLELNVLTDSQTPIRLVVDAHFLPGLENEAAFGTNIGPPLPDDNLNGERDVYDHHFSGIQGLLPDDPAATPEQEYYSDWTYANRRGRARLTITAFAGADLSALDASCLAAHVGESSFCLDELHVLLNHVSTPFFVRMDLRDNVWIDGPAVFGAQSGSAYDWPDQAFVERIDKQVRDYLDYYSTYSEIAGDTDTSGDPLCVDRNDLKPQCWPRGMWAPSAGGSASHTGLLDAYHFGTGSPSLQLSLCEDVAGTLIETRHTMGSTLRQWLVNDAHIEARPFYDRLGTRERYWIDPRAATCEVELDCANGLDDDGDGSTDSADSDCQ